MTGLVYLAIIALWAVFLIPWLSRHRDEFHVRRSGGRYQRALDSLAASDEQADDGSDEAYADRVSGSGVELPSWQPLASLGALLGRRSKAGDKTLKRRRRVLIVLAVSLAATLGATLAGYLPGIVPVVVASLSVLYCGVLVRASRTVAGPVRVSPSSEARREEARRAQRQAQALLRGRQPVANPEPGRWDAVPTTLPTYVTKPKAAKVPRVMDLKGAARGSEGEAMVARAQEEQERARRAAAERQFDREIAVVEPDAMEEVAELASPSEPEEYRPPFPRAANG